MPVYLFWKTSLQISHTFSQFIWRWLDRATFEEKLESETMQDVRKNLFRII
jgi:hypothetical protein